MAFKDGVIFC